MDFLVKGGLARGFAVNEEDEEDEDEEEGEGGEGG